jgi:hypothetical protein
VTEQVPICAVCGAVDRNAALAVLLRHAIARLHALERGHTGTSWTQCPEDLCRRVTHVLKTRAVV